MYATSNDEFYRPPIWVCGCVHSAQTKDGRYGVLSSEEGSSNSSFNSSPVKLACCWCYCIECGLIVFVTSHRSTAKYKTAGRIEPSPKTPRNNLRKHTHTYSLSNHPNGRPTVVFKVYICKQAPIYIWRKEPVRSQWPGLTYTHSTSQSHTSKRANNICVCYVLLLYLTVFHPRTLPCHCKTNC